MSKYRELFSEHCDDSDGFYVIVDDIESRVNSIIKQLEDYEKDNAQDLFDNVESALSDLKDLATDLY